MCIKQQGPPHFLRSWVRFSAETAFWGSLFHDDYAVYFTENQTDFPGFIALIHLGVR
jgi:hypothetical protein